MAALPNDIWVVIPAYNEELYISRVLTKIKKYTTRIIVVDDGSSDSTATEAEKNAAYVLSHRLNLGKGAALKTGCDFAFFHLNARAIIMMDADDQHDPTELTLFCDALASGHSLVFGSRDFSSMPLTRKAGNQLASQLINLVYGQYVPDIPSGYKAFTAAVYQQIAWQTTDYAVELEIAIKTVEQKIPFKVVPIKTIYHDFTKGMTALDTLSMLKQIISYKIHL